MTTMMVILGAVGLVLVLRLRAIQFGPPEPPPRNPESPLQIEAPPRQPDPSRELEAPRQARVGPDKTRAGKRAAKRPAKGKLRAKRKKKT